MDGIIQQQLTDTLNHKGQLSRANQNALDYANYMKSQQQPATASPALPPIDTGQPTVADPSASSGPMPQDVNAAQQQTGNTSFSGLCEAFVEAMTGSGWKGSTAINAFQNQLQAGAAVPGTKGIKPGDPIYFTADSSNDGEGHVGIYAGGNKFVSATSNGVATVDLNEWNKQTGQQVVGYVPQEGGKSGN